MLLVKPKVLLLVGLLFCYVEVKAKYRHKFQDFVRDQGRHGFSLVREEYKEASSSIDQPMKRESVLFQASCQNPILRSTISNYLVVGKDYPMKVDLIREFLAIKFLQYHDLINSIMILDSQQRPYDLKSFFD